MENVDLQLRHKRPPLRGRTSHAGSFGVPPAATLEPDSYAQLAIDQHFISAKNYFLNQQMTIIRASIEPGRRKMKCLLLKVADIADLFRSRRRRNESAKSKRHLFLTMSRRLKVGQAHSDSQ